jgi:hypothetical protein
MMSEEYQKMLGIILLKRENIVPSDFTKIYLTDYSRRNALRQCHIKGYIRLNPKNGRFDINDEKIKEISDLAGGLQR